MFHLLLVLGFDTCHTGGPQIQTPHIQIKRVNIPQPRHPEDIKLIPINELLHSSMYHIHDEQQHACCWHQRLVYLINLRNC